MSTRQLVLAAFTILLLIPSSGCVTARVPHTGLKVPVPSLEFMGLAWPGLGEGDLSRMPWDNAFIAMQARMQREYPFTAWKKIDWAKLEAEFLPKVREAQAKNDPQAYYMALRSFAYAIPDSHVTVSDVPAYRFHDIGGGLGFAVHRMDDGRVIAHVLEDGGPAASAGMRWGAEILAWNGKALAEAVAQVPVLWAQNAPATPKARLTEQYRFLTRLPVNTQVTVTFRNEDAAQPTEVTLTAKDDNYSSLNRAGMFEKPLDDNGSPFDVLTLPDNIGYIRIRAVGPTLSVPFPDRAFAAALQGFLDAQVRGLILDLRRNSGGSDALAATLCGHFYTQDQHFEEVAAFDRKLNAFTLRDDLALRVTPKAPHFSGDVLVLIDNTTMDAGEGIALLLERLPNVRLVGTESTRGAFALTGGGIEMPGGTTLIYPIGRSLDAAGNIQVESNAEGQGGLTPDVLLPVDRDYLYRRFVNVENIVLDKARALLAQDAQGGSASR